jgi:hypothetical protein
VSRPHPTRRPVAFALLATVALAALLARSARAQEEGEGETKPSQPIRMTLPNAVRASGALYTPWFDWGDILGGVTYARQLSIPVALELTIGGGGPGGKYNAVHAGGGLRITAVGGWEHPHSLTVAFGAEAATLRQFGVVGFAHAELAWELRTTSGFAMILGGGVGTTLNDSRVVTDCRNTWFPCRDHYAAGTIGPRGRFELGWAF